MNVKIVYNAVKLLKNNGKMIEQRLYLVRTLFQSDHRSVKVNNQVIIECVRQCLDQDGIHNTICFQFSAVQSTS